LGDINVGRDAGKRGRENGYALSYFSKITTLIRTENLRQTVKPRLYEFIYKFLNNYGISRLFNL
jgi:hypothetical protein